MNTAPCRRLLLSKQLFIPMPSAAQRDTHNTPWLCVQALHTACPLAPGASPGPFPEGTDRVTSEPGNSSPGRGQTDRAGKWAGSTIQLCLDVPEEWRKDTGSPQFSPGWAPVSPLQQGLSGLGPCSPGQRLVPPHPGTPAQGPCSAEG